MNETAETWINNERVMYVEICKLGEDCEYKKTNIPEELSKRKSMIGNDKAFYLIDEETDKLKDGMEIYKIIVDGKTYEREDTPLLTVRLRDKYIEIFGEVEEA